MSVSERERCKKHLSPKAFLIRALPTLQERRAAARAMAPLVAAQDRAIRAHGRSVGADPEFTTLRADKMFVLTLRGFEGPCEWTQAEAFEAMAERR